MEDLYSIHPGISRGFGISASASEICPSGSSSDSSDLLKSQIASHPRYPSLISAYIECRKVGAPPEMATLLEEMGREKKYESDGMRRMMQIGADPELDDFMENYCAVLAEYKEELSKPLNEAATFLSSIESQLRNLCSFSSSSSSNGCTTTTTTGVVTSDEAVGSSEEDINCGDVETSDRAQEGGSRLADQELKEMLLKKYSGNLSNLRKEFLKKRKKGKLPKDARLALLDWWNTHYRWPYPTEEEKAKLADMTGLDQKQINNWFINQRKRHWKPSEDMRFALMEGVSGGGGSSGTTLYFDTGTIGP